MERKSVWVLWWNEDDGSDTGVVRVYEDRDRASEDMNLLNEYSTVNYHVSEVLVF